MTTATGAPMPRSTSGSIGGPMRARIEKLDTRIQPTAYGRGALLLGLLFVLAGGYFTLAGLGISTLPSPANAPLEVIAAIGASFALAGVWLAALGLRGIARRRRLERRARENPGEAWWADYPWDPRGERDRPFARAAGALFTAGFLVLFLVPFNWWAFVTDDAPAMVRLGVGLFDLIGLGALGTALHRLLAAAKHGRSQIVFARFPFHPGERVEMRLSPVRETALTAKLRFVEERFVTRGTGRHRRVHHEAFALSESDVAVAPGDREATLTARLPDDPDLVDCLRADPTVRYWELVVEAAGPGVDYRTTFPVPVYPRPDSPAGAGARAVGEPHPPLTGHAGRYFEVKLGVALAVLIALAAGAFPDRIAGVWHDLAVRAATRSLAGVSSDAMDVALAPDGAVWVLSKYTVHEYPGADRERARQWVGGGGAKAPESLSSLGVSGPRIWLGGWRGFVGSLDARSAAILATDRNAGEPAVGRVTAFAAFRGTVHVAARGVWAIGSDGATLQPVPGPPAAPGHALLADGDTALYAALGSELWRLDEGGWRRLWRAEASDGDVRALHLSPRRTVWVGTGNGLVELDEAGGVRRRGLPGTEVRAIAAGAGGLWLATWNRGLLGVAPARGELAATHLRVLVGERLSDLAFDRGGGLWIAVYGGGARFIPSRAVERLASAVRSAE